MPKFAANQESPSVPHERAHDTDVAKLKLAAAAGTGHGLRLLIEPVSTFDIPGCFLSASRQALAILDACGADRLFLQHDIDHMQRMEGELADNPGRREPGTGEIDDPYLSGVPDDIGYDGWVGCEYIPGGDPVAGLGWRDRWRQQHPYTTMELPT
jgi:hydroxypyruvate isomerase